MRCVAQLLFPVLKEDLDPRSLDTEDKALAELRMKDEVALPVP
jgi:hypothetical protein